jgi:hypothetical protein
MPGSSLTLALATLAPDTSGTANIPITAAAQAMADILRIIPAKTIVDIADHSLPLRASPNRNRRLLSDEWSRSLVSVPLSGQVAYKVVNNLAPVGGTNARPGGRRSI